MPNVRQMGGARLCDKISIILQVRFAVTLSFNVLGIYGKYTLERGNTLFDHFIYIGCLTYYSGKSTTK